MDRISRIAEGVASKRASSVYSSIIRSLLSQIRRSDIKPEYVESYLRLQFGTLDGLSHDQFAKEIPDIVSTIDADPRSARELTRSYGL